MNAPGSAGGYLLEAEKSTLALAAWGERMDWDLLPLGMGGCYGWRGQHIAKAIAPSGEREDVAGPLPDLSFCNGRKVYVLLDANAATNPMVLQARVKLTNELCKQARHCTVLVCDLPIIEGVNGPDDYISICGDEAMAQVFASAHPPTHRPAINIASHEPASAVPPLLPDEAAALTSSLLEKTCAWIMRFVVVTIEQATILAAWVLHTYVIEAAEWTPYLHITGPEKACGKTLLMDVLASLAYNSRTASGCTPAALVRIVDKYQPTLFLDEMDAATHGNKEMAEALRGILDAGFKRGEVFYKCDGKNNDLRAFNVFCPKCFAGIGNLPSTIANRSIPIEMRRKLHSERIERYRSRVIAPLVALLRDDLQRWRSGVIGLLKAIEPQPIDALLDRTNNVAEILLAIAQIARGTWPARLSAALLAIYGSAAAEDSSTGVILLHDIQNIFAERKVAYLSSKELVAVLCEMEGHPWAEWYHGHELSANSLARLLKPYRIYPQTIRFGDTTPKGYRRSDFEDAWARYCPSTGILTATTTQPASLLAQTAFFGRNKLPAVAVMQSGSDQHKQRVVACGDTDETNNAQGCLFDTPSVRTIDDENTLVKPQFTNQSCEDEERL